MKRILQQLLSLVSTPYDLEAIHFGGIFLIIGFLIISPVLIFWALFGYIDWFASSPYLIPGILAFIVGLGAIASAYKTPSYSLEDLGIKLN